MSLRQGEDEDTFESGDTIDNRFKVIRRLGRGGYGEIYSAKDHKTSELVAVKVERISKPGNLVHEEEILRALQVCKWVPHVIATGKHEGATNYICMELLGDNLSDTRRSLPKRQFSLLTTLMVAQRMLIALKDVHDAGYVHRDIKPGNFVLGKAKTATQRGVYILDFGLSKKHLKKDGTPKPKASSVKWVGSRRYMSLNTHARKEQGRRDDLWSLLYVLIEFHTGTLPWGHLRGIENMEKVRDIKEQYNNKKLVKGLPNTFALFFNYIGTLKYETRPDYEMLLDLFKSKFTEIGGDENTLYDWETPKSFEIAKKLEAGQELDDIESSSTSSSLTALAASISNPQEQGKFLNLQSSPKSRLGADKRAQPTSPRAEQKSQQQPVNNDSDSERGRCSVI
eukprot:TRINITY_DN1347_c0_g1_i2.p1 TRINITY_DN1347_c0_g1~~TRINITY_DN1347_c0_g1_i2.p1  ORF type:complete len:396 (-),score=80.11 TRINITY_DN1347_c0_g1_i2:367-1554(-)